MHNIKNQFGGGCAGGWVGKEKEGGQREGEGVTVKERERPLFGGSSYNDSRGGHRTVKV